MASWGSIYINTVYGVKMHTNRLARLQEQVASGARIIRASDGPADAFRIQSLRDSVATFDNYTNNLREVELSLEEGSNAINQCSEIANRVGVLVAQGATGTYGPQNRQAIAGEIDELLEQAISLANHQVLGRHIFGGADSVTAPYQVTRENGKIVNVQYTGSFEERPIPVAPGVDYSGQIIGDSIFRTNKREAPTFHSETGAAVGTGTSSVRGDFWMEISKGAPLYDSASGISANANAINTDTIDEFTNHQITVSYDTGAGSGTISLNGGANVAITAGDTNVTVTGPGGETIHIDVDAGITDQVAQNYTFSNGMIQIDQGPMKMIDYSDANMMVRDVNDRILYVDATGISDNGLVNVNVGGTYDFFNQLIYVRDLMRNTKELDANEQIAVMGRAQYAMEQITSGFLQRSTMLGGRLGSVERLKDTLDNLRYNAGSEADGVEQADVVELATDLARTQTLYEMSLAATSKVISLTLLDYIR